MKIRTLALSTAILVTATGYALAQTPTERAGSKTDNGTTQMQNDTKMAPSGMSKSDGMSGAGMTSPSTGPTSEKANGPMTNKNVSPSSMNSGEKQQK